MRRAWLFGLVGLAVAAVGCGGALSSGAGGAGGAGTGAGAGSASSTGSGGSGPAGGTTGGHGTSSGAAGRSPYEGGYTWGDTQVYVGPSDTAPDSFSFEVRDLSMEAGIKTMSTLPAATRYPPNDGAHLTVHYGGCGSAAPYQLDIDSCATSQDGTTPPGCIALSLNDRGVMTGEYVAADGGRCTIQSGSANILVPLPAFTLPADGGLPPGASTGSFGFQCNRADGALWHLDGQFAIPVQSTFLACAPPLQGG